MVACKSLAGVRAEEAHETPGKALAGDDGMPRQDPCRATRQGPHQGRQRGHCEAHTSQVSAIDRMQLLSQPAGQAPAWQHAALRGGSTTAPPQLPACLHGTACIAGQGACKSQEGRRRTGWASPPSPGEGGPRRTGEGFGSFEPWQHPELVQELKNTKYIHQSRIVGFYASLQPEPG